MFRCGSCGSGYSVQAAATWDSCPRCLAKERAHVPLTLEFGWRQQAGDLRGSDEEERQKRLDSPVLAMSGRSAAVASSR